MNYLNQDLIIIITATMETKQSAVDYLLEQIKNCSLTFYNEGDVKMPISLGNVDVVKQAKAMEKEQHFDTWTDSRIENKGDNYIGKEKSFEKYYNETYGKTN